MRLPKELLEGFLYFEHNLNAKYSDEFKVHRKVKKSFLWFKWNKLVVEKYEISRTRSTKQHLQQKNFIHN